jgi:hypothetical protein
LDEKGRGTIPLPLFYSAAAEERGRYEPVRFDNLPRGLGLTAWALKNWSWTLLNLMNSNLQY